MTLKIKILKINQENSFFIKNQEITRKNRKVSNPYTKRNTGIHIDVIGEILDQTVKIVDIIEV